MKKPFSFLRLAMLLGFNARVEAAGMKFPGPDASVSPDKVWELRSQPQKPARPDGNPGSDPDFNLILGFLERTPNHVNLRHQ